MSVDLGWADSLSRQNVLALLDVLYDIRDELQLNPGKPQIPIWPQVIRFRELFPGDSIGMRDRYCEIRYKAMQLLRDRGLISQLGVNQGTHRWESQLTFTATIAPIYSLINRLEQGSVVSVSSSSPARLASKSQADTPSEAHNIFIGHGGSADWRELKDFLVERLHLSVDEFNAQSAAGLATKERLEQMLETASFAFLVATAEDSRADGSMHARENVVHEIGLFQGRLGFKKAIVVLEEGCTEFTNIIGVTQLRYPKGRISAVFEEARRVLERESILTVV